MEIEFTLLLNWDSGIACQRQPQPQEGTSFIFKIKPNAPNMDDIRVVFHISNNGRNAWTTE